MFRTFAAAAALVLVTSIGAAAGEARVGADTALLVIDIQNFYFEGGLIPLTGPVPATEQARRVLDAFRARQLTVVHVRHVPQSVAIVDDEPADAQYRIRPIVAPSHGEKVVTKRQINSFRDTDLLEYLRRKGIKKLVIVGMQTHMCVEGASRAAADFGFDVTVIHDACATRPLEFNGHTAAAIDVHTTALAAIKNNYGRVVSAEELLKELQ
jgi:nicotinamidase-related amidase